jgi:3'-phosphoadenosine 5'-phosphosulfate sulfotransferase (PAPS reductase)/FAD synthetase
MKMELYDTFEDFFRDCPAEAAESGAVRSALLTAWEKLRGAGAEAYRSVMVAVSGGADSDTVMDIMERVGHPFGKVHYVFYDSGIEFEATKRHLSFLEEKYGVGIERREPEMSVPLCAEKFGVPFLSKRAGDYIRRLQSHGFQWEVAPFEELRRKYPRCESALRWWCNEWGENSRMNIQRRRWLREFMSENPPDFPISDRCCEGAKKATAKQAEKEIRPDLTVTGVRKAEGGARASAYGSCFDRTENGPDRWRPIFEFRDADRRVYERAFGVTHSDCYSVYGLTRTGCAGCPLGRNFEAELEAAKKYEPKLYAAALSVFGDAYAYTRAYRAYARARDAERSRSP